MDRQNESSGIPFLAALFVLVVLGLILRLQGLFSMSIDLEEHACTGALNASNPFQFLVDQRALYPYGAPLVPLLFYFWSGVAGDSIAAIRLFVLPFGLALIPVMYWAGRVFFGGHGRWVGLTAAMITALSPVQFMHSQEARMYAFLSLFALLSCIALVKAASSESRGWWRLNLLFNALVLWSHLFGLLLIATQAVWLIFFVQPGWSTMKRWCITHASLAIPIVLWAVTVPYAGAPLYAYYTPPSARIIFHDLFADEIVRWSSLAYWQVPGGVYQYPDWFINLRGVIDTSLLCMFVAIVISFALGTTITWLRRRELSSWRDSIFVLGWYIGPITALVIVSYIGQPVYSSRYSAYSELALYLMAGACVAWLPRCWLRAAAFTVIAALMSYQMALAVPAPTRTQWREAMEQVRSTSGANAPLLVEDPFWLQVVHRNWESDGRIVEAAFKRVTLAATAALCLGAHSRQDAVVWVLLVDITGEGREEFESLLGGQDLRFEMTDYYGERPLHLYRIVRESQNPTQSECVYESVAMPLLDQAQSVAIEDFRRVSTYEPDERGGVYVRLGFAYGDRDQRDAACLALERAAATFDGTDARMRELAGLVQSSDEVNATDTPGLRHDAGLSR